MSLHSSMSPKAIFNRINRDQTSSGEPLPMRSILNNAVFESLAVIRMGKATKPDKLAKAEATKAEADEQLKLLNLCDFIREFDAANLKKAIEAFDAETERMRQE